MKAQAILFLVAALVGSDGVLQNTDSSKLRLHPSGLTQSLPERQNFRISCELVNRDPYWYMQWISPSGLDVRRKGSKVQVQQRNGELFLTLFSPTVADNGRYVCKVAYNRTHADTVAVDLSFYTVARNSRGPISGPATRVANTRKINFCAREKGGCAHTCFYNRYGESYCKCHQGFLLNDDQRTCRVNLSWEKCPDRQTLYEGYPDRIICEVASPVFKFSVTWQKDGRKIGSRRYAVESGGLRVDEVTQQDAGEYIATVATTGRQYKESRKIQVQVEEPVDIKWENCPEHQVLTAGRSGRINCRVTGNPRPRIAWIKDGGTLGKRFTVDEDGVAVSEATMDDVGDFGIEVTNKLTGNVELRNIKVHVQDVNECEDNNFNCSHECVNTPGSAYCACPMGYQLDTSFKTCVDTDECKVSNGGCENLCHNSIGSFSCSCKEGYAISGFYSCEDIDECSKENGGCGHKCNNYLGGHYCGCNDGFSLESDQKSCAAIRCPRLPVPLHSNISCFKGRVKSANAVKIQDSEEFPNGTICRFECHKGYKLSSFPPQIICRPNGTWNAVPPTCVALQCHALTRPKNGNIHPSSCRRGSAEVRKSCFFTCKRGYRLKGSATFRCSTNREWLPKVSESPTCVPVKITPYITCPDDITMVLPTGQQNASVFVPDPQTGEDVQRVSVTPEWVRLGDLNEFPAGATDIVYAVESPTDANLTSSCAMTVTLLDEESPKMVHCPEPFSVKANDSMGVTVTWTDPTFSDNVEVSSISKNMVSNTTLRPGTYSVKYTASDAAANTAECKFTITVTGSECGFPKDPDNGKMNCYDWVFGRICEVECNSGFTLYPPEHSTLVCDDFGTWEPSNATLHCSRVSPTVNSSCRDGFELMISPDTSEEICVECPTILPWSPLDGKCSEEYLPN